MKVCLLALLGGIALMCVLIGGWSAGAAGFSGPYVLVGGLLGLGAVTVAVLDRP